MTVQQSNKRTISRIVSIVLTALIALAAVFGYDVIVDQPREQRPAGELTMTPPPAVARDTSHLTGLNVSGPVTFDDTLDVGGSLNYGAANLYPLGSGTGNLKVVQGLSATFTGTLTVTHGLSTITSVTASLCQAPTANAADAYATVSGTTVLIKTVKADGATAGSVGTRACYMIAGAP